MSAAQRAAWRELFVAARYFRDNVRDVVAAVGHEATCEVWADRAGADGASTDEHVRAAIGEQFRCTCAKVQKTGELLEACAKVAEAVNAVEAASRVSA